MPPILVATASTLDALEAIARADTASRRIDWVEARFDQLAESAWARAAVASRTLCDTGTPVLATIRWSAEGGAYPADDDARAERYVALLSDVHAIDVELASRHAEALVRAAHARGRLTVLSSHDFVATPDADTLHARIDRGLALGADVVKIAAMTKSPADYPRMVAALERAPSGRVALLGMGPYGVALRAFLPAAGSALAYGYLDAPAAPGQLSAAELGELLTRFVPGYRPGARPRIDG